MDYEGLFLLLVAGGAVYFTAGAFSALSDIENQPKGYLTAQIIKAIGLWLVFFSSIIQ